MSKDKLPRLFDGSIDELMKPSKPKRERNLKREKMQKTLYVSRDMNMKLIQLYAEEGRRQSAIVEDAVNLYYYLRLALGEKKFGELLSAVKREDPEFLRDYMSKLRLK